MSTNSQMSQEQLRIKRRREELELKREEKKMKKKGQRKAFLLILIFILVFLFYEKGIDFNFKFNFDFDFLKKGKAGEETVEAVNSKLEGNFIAYVPIDDRPIHTTRISFLAESIGYELKMPDTKYIKTYLTSGENSYAGYTTKYGNPAKVASWLLEMEEAGCDYYIISLDQLFSGGIAGSAYLSDEDFEVYGNSMSNAKKVFEKIIKDKKNHVYVIDSVMGLSVIPGFMDFTIDDDYLLSEYTRNHERVELTGEDLSISRIVEEYGNDKDGNSIATEMDVEKLGKYLAARERKLMYSKYALESIFQSDNSKNIHIYYGIEDAVNSSNNIQKNDIAYLKKLIEDNHLSVSIQDGVSSLSEEAFGDMLLDAIDHRLSVKTTYYGDKTQKVTSTGETYEEYIDQLYKDLSIYSDQDTIDFEVLVYTKTVSIEDREKNANLLLKHYLENIKKHVPTIIINGASVYEDKVLIENLSDYSKTSVPMGYLIGYSNWNGFVHSSRIALTEGITRYLYLVGNKKNEKCDRGFLKVMMQSYVEDMAYLPSNRYSTDLRIVEEEMDQVTNQIKKNLVSGNFISNLVTYEEKGIKSIDIYNYNFPWGRGNELYFDVSPTLGEAKNIKVPSEVKYSDEK